MDRVLCLIKNIDFVLFKTQSNVRFNSVKLRITSTFVHFKLDQNERFC